MTYGFSVQTGKTSESKVVFDSDSFATGYLIYSQVIDMPSEYYSDNVDYTTKSTYPNGLGWTTIDLTNVEPSLGNIGVTWEMPSSGFLNSSNFIPFSSILNESGISGIQFYLKPPNIVKISNRIYSIKYNPVFWRAPGTPYTWRVDSIYFNALWKCKVNFYGF